MSRYCGNKDSTETIKAVDIWKEKCLLNDGSIFSDLQVWTPDSFSELHQYFTENPDEGSDNFLDKLEKQLEPAKKETKMLAAEMLWFMQLFVSEEGMHAETKRQQLQRVWSWAGEELDMRHPLVTTPLADGIGRPGVAYNTRRWAELKFFIGVGGAFKLKSEEERTQLLSDPWEFSSWLDSFTAFGKVQLRHIMKFLLFPDYFERITTGRHKREIVNAFRNKNLKPGKFNFTEVDKEIYEIRKELEEQYGTTEIDFYTTPEVKAVWQNSSKPKSKSALSREHVESAINEIDKRGVQIDEKSVTYDLIYEGKRYPPKLVYSLAHKHSAGEPLDRASFEGGENTRCFKELRELGFIIERKDFVVELLENFIFQAQEGKDLATSQYPKSFSGLNVKVSFGQGVFTHVPWISFTGYKQTTPNGIYPVFLFYRSIGVLVLAYGISETNPPSIKWPDEQNRERIADYLQRKYSHKAEKYGESYVHSAYQVPIDHSAVNVTADLDSLIHEYRALMRDQSSKAPEQEPAPSEPLEPAILDPAAIAESFASALEQSNIKFGTRHNQIARSFVSSLMTKPLVILTGLSGSGKTQIAIRFGEWLGANRMRVVAVRPDWTGAEALFGYEDALKPSIDGRPAWSVPETLQFFLEASRNPGYPYLLVLDEMNLAHVERYFADVLSGIESAQPCLPNLKREEDGNWRIPEGESEKLPFPQNVFIVGTVNIDETTYMFSPKVLDRANTFEFRVATEDLASEYYKPIPCSPGDVGLVRGFLEIGTDSNWQYEHETGNKEAIGELLRQVHNLLMDHGFEFGHRVFYESQRYASIFSAVHEEDHNAVLDMILMQKIMPRLHGSRRRLEDLLRSLAEFCFQGSVKGDSEVQVSLFEPDQVRAQEAKLPISFDKLSRMLKSLRANQFTSFTE